MKTFGMDGGFFLGVGVFWFGRKFVMYFSLLFFSEQRS